MQFDPLGPMVYRYPLSIPFQDIDAAGRVFFAHLFRYAHEAYEAFMCEIDQPLAQWLAEGQIHLPLVHAEADYHHALYYAQKIVLELRIEAIGVSSFTLITRCMGVDKNCYAVIKTVHVVQNSKTNMSIDIPSSLSSGLEAYCAMPNSD